MIGVVNFRSHFLAYWKKDTFKMIMANLSTHAFNTMNIPRPKNEREHSSMDFVTGFVLDKNFPLYSALDLFFNSKECDKIWRENTWHLQCLERKRIPEMENWIFNTSASNFCRQASWIQNVPLNAVAKRILLEIYVIFITVRHVNKWMSTRENPFLYPYCVQRLDFPRFRVACGSSWKSQTCKSRIYFVFCLLDRFFNKMLRSANYKNVPAILHCYLCLTDCF